MKLIIGKCFFGSMLGVVYDLCSFLFLKALLPTSVLDTVLIAAPFVFAISSMLTEITVAAEKQVCNEKSFSALWIHVFVMLVAVMVEALLFYTGVVSSVYTIVAIGIFSIVMVEVIYRPEILQKWNKFYAVFIIVLVVPVFMLYLALLLKSFLLFVLLLMVCSMLLANTYHFN